ncbi:XAC2610-related protein [Hymenobacter chitinivorans]|uniref:VCBS repeat protein n=1 Tax=Hymenobacter chitinivorans DSM 11115 TaxID=1121954 RepID=A0A2M9BQM6_9BACT|nr:hypothetical protein [Hymenobacter chitinivorans]PJJ60271.1 hypothetical protein CLV45_1696 [Hymenobacter chitinivorans DSM 11115]
MTLRFSLLLLLSLSLGTASQAQRRFTLSAGSARYSAELTVAGCADGQCEGPGTVRLFSKQTKQLVQTFTSADLNFFLDDKNHTQPTVNVVELYGEQSPLIFADFNFDGTEDLAIRNGNNSSYGGPSYDVYVYASRPRKFVPSAELTTLASENLGMFQVDRARQRLITYEKDGCCWHLTTEYAVVPGKGLLETKTVEEDATSAAEQVVVTTRQLVQGRWRTAVRRFPLKEYYKD